MWAWPLADRLQHHVLSSVQYCHLQHISSFKNKYVPLADFFGIINTATHKFAFLWLYTDCCYSNALGTILSPKIFARWVPHLLTDEQNRQRVKVAKKLLQMFQTCDKNQFANVVTGDETCGFYFEHVRNVSKKIWATKHSKRPIVVERSLSAR